MSIEFKIRDSQEGLKLSDVFYISSAKLAVTGPDFDAALIVDRQSRLHLADQKFSDILELHRRDFALFQTTTILSSDLLVPINILLSVSQIPEDDLTGGYIVKTTLGDIKTFSLISPEDDVAHDIWQPQA